MVGRRILITGGLGFIGSYLAEHFLENGDRVTIVDSLVSNVVEPAFFDVKYPEVHIVQSSVADHFATTPDLTGYDLFIHAASLVGPASLIDDAGSIGSDIVLSTACIIEQCRKADIPLLHFSSAEVYGRSGVLDEAHEIRVPPYYNARIEYALAKLTSEAMISNSQHRGLRAIVIRPFNVAGPRQSRAGGFVLPTFVQQALGGRPLTVFGSGQQTRAFLGIDDLVQFVAQRIDNWPAEPFTIYNVGNPDNATTIQALAERVIRLLGSRSTLVQVDPKSVYGPLYFEAESFEKVPAIGKARALGWEPRQTLDDTIRQCAAYYRDHRDPRGRDART
ncbi:MAG: NAD(P)-dependent oxidoreductase [Pseudomonadota bacterium]